MTGMEHAAEVREAVEDVIIEYGRECENAMESFHAARPDLSGAVSQILDLFAPAQLREGAEEAYQRGHEDGYWNGKTTDMSPAEAASFMAPYRSRCGAWGGCPLPAGHNVGQADIPENHAEGDGRDET